MSSDVPNGNPARSTLIQSRPLIDIDESCNQSMVPAARDRSDSAYVGSPVTANTPRSSLSWLTQQAATQQRHASMTLAVAQNQNKFIEDLLTAESSHNAMERYKALIRLMSALRRRMAQARISQPDKPQSWEGHEHQDVLKQIVMVGECLARFGTAEFSERSNASRAINTKDYATLLTQFLEAHGTIFAMEFITQLPQTLQDEVLTVRSLLQTRCEANSILFGQLVKHVGLENQGQGQAVVYNTNLVTANPTAISAANPKTWVQVASSAWAKATEKRSNRFGMMGAAALLALWVLKGKLPGGGRRGGRWRGGDSEEEYLGRGRRGGPGSGGPLGLAERLLEMRNTTERTAVSHLVACSEELARAQHNVELLTHDWRIGQVRLGGGLHPPGFQPIDPSRCSLYGYLHSLQEPSGSHHLHLNPAPAPHRVYQMYQAPPLVAQQQAAVPAAGAPSSEAASAQQQQQLLAMPTAAVTLSSAPVQKKQRRRSKRNDSNAAGGASAAAAQAASSSDSGQLLSGEALASAAAAAAAIPAAIGEAARQMLQQMTAST